MRGSQLSLITGLWLSWFSTQYPGSDHAVDHRQGLHLDQATCLQQREATVQTLPTEWMVGGSGTQRRWTRLPDGQECNLATPVLLPSA